MLRLTLLATRVHLHGVMSACRRNLGAATPGLDLGKAPEMLILPAFCPCDCISIGHACLLMLSLGLGLVLGLGPGLVLGLGLDLMLTLGLDLILSLGSRCAR